MSDTNDNDPDEATDAESSGPRCGERLAEARRKQEISVQEVAKELHLDELKVRALERNEFDVLGAPVFAKGYLRKYSQLVGVDIDDVFVDYYSMTRAEGMPPIVAGRKKIRQEMSPGPWIAVAAVLLVAAAAYWFFVLRVESEISMETPTDEPVLPMPDPELEPADESRSVIEPQEQAEAPDIDSVEPAEQVVAETAVPDGQISLSLMFSGECWTEISDADGRQLFFNMAREGQNIELSGKAPITALFGNADNVEVLVNDNPYSLPAPDAGNNTVRVAILGQ